MFVGELEPEAFAHPYFYLAIFSVAICGLLTVYSLRNNQNKYTQYFAVFCGTAFVWDVTTLFMFLFDKSLIHYIPAFVSVFSIILMGWAWLMFTLYYTSNNPSRVQWYILTAIPTAVTLIVFHALYTKIDTYTIYLQSAGVTVSAMHKTGPIEVQLIVVFMFAYAMIGDGTLILNAYQHSKQNSRQYQLLIASSIIMLGGGFLDALHLHPYPNTPLSPYVIALATFTLWLSIYVYGFVEVLPVARSKVIKSLPLPVFVVDKTNTLIDVNRTGTEILGKEQSQVHNTALSETAPELAASLPDNFNTETRTEINLQIQGEPRYYNARIAPFTNSNGEYAGASISLDDVTVQRRQQDKLEQQKSELERQNEQLDDFASVLSHDLRNPLNTAQMYTDMAEDTGSEDAFGTLRQSLNRMDEMIDDLLTLAREGQSINELTTVALEEVTDNTWDIVELDPDASLSVVDTRLIEADATRLQNVFENLFRNSIEHSDADTPTEIKVGWLDSGDGFYVEDNGPGIPEEHRDDVFDHGVTYSDEGTGFGLSIVKQTVEAHGWRVSVTDGEQLGGARFEVTGVQPVADAVENR